MNEQREYVTQNCSECGNCVDVCPKTAIYWETLQLGTRRAKIDLEKCVHCGLCERYCPIESEMPFTEPSKAFAFVSMSNEAKKSTSGGAFYELAKEVLRRNGVVFGAVYDEKLKVCHDYIESADELEKMQGSKYVRSDMGNCIEKVIEFLKCDRWVLYSGTPCQVAAVLKRVAGCNRDKLILVDIICHGTPSGVLFNDYVESLSRKGKRVTKFDFRDKKYGHKLIGSYIIGAHRKHLYSSESSYYKLFLGGLIYGENCYSCKFACPERISDLTIGDYWGVKREHPEFFTNFHLSDDTSVSAAMVNTAKGTEIMDAIRPNICLMEVDYQSVVRNNPQLNNPMKVSGNRVEIVQAYEANGYSGIESWFQKNTNYRKYILRVASWIPVGIKNLMKKIRRNLYIR